MKTERHDLERLISRILFAGVALSLTVETLGLLGYIAGFGTLDVIFSPQWQTGGKDFFGYTWALLTSIPQGVTSVTLIALGIIILMITPYARVVASLIYFAIDKNPKYVLITLFVLAVLSASLLAY
jgi:uncharacterized membrane protein